MQTMKSWRKRVGYRWFAVWQQKLALAAGLLVGGSTVHAADYNVGSSTDFFNALQSIRDTPNQDDRIILQGAINLAQDVLAIVKDTNFTLTVVGNGHTIDAGNSFRPFFVHQGNLVLQDLTIQNGQAKGGDGAGGGLGAGGAIFVGEQAAVRLQGVNFIGNSAVGGGGTTNANDGGGGLGGDATGSSGFGGRGGGGGLHGNGGPAFFTGSAGGVVNWGTAASLPVVEVEGAEDAFSMAATPRIALAAAVAVFRGAPAEMSEGTMDRTRPQLEAVVVEVALLATAAREHSLVAAAAAETL